MKNLNKKEGQIKIKFYDTLLWIALGSFVLTILAVVTNRTETLSTIFIIIFIILLIIVWWGIIYNLFKRKYWGWFWVTLIFAVLFGAGAILGIIVYFSKIRKDFKEGRLIPKDKYDFWGNTIKNNDKR